MKKLILVASTVGLIASINTYAAVPTGAAPFQVVVPNLKSGLEFTVEGLYLQPANSDLDYATFTTATSNSTNTSVSTVNPDYDFGFRIGLGYVFPNSGNDVQLGWTHFDNSDNDNANNNGVNGIIITRGGSIFSSSDSTFVANSNADFDYDAVDLDVGQYISIGTRLQARLFAGLRYAQVKNDLVDTYTLSSAASVTASGYETFNSKFTGIGPRLGVNVNYHVGDCFGVVGQVSTALLVGRVESSSIISETFLSRAEDPVISSDNQTRVVPAIDAKLGIDYSWPLHNDAQRFTIEAGYQVTQYIDAIDRLSSAAGEPVAGGNLMSINNGNVVRTTSGIGFNGPYLSLNYKM